MSSASLNALLLLVSPLLVHNKLVKRILDQFFLDLQFVVRAEVGKDDEQGNEDAYKYAAEEDEA